VGKHSVEEKQHTATWGKLGVGLGGKGGVVTAVEVINRTTRGGGGGFAEGGGGGVKSTEVGVESVGDGGGEVKVGVGRFGGRRNCDGKCVEHTRVD